MVLKKTCDLSMQQKVRTKSESTCVEGRCLILMTTTAKNYRLNKLKRTKPTTRKN